jgi:hypothetical protein
MVFYSLSITLFLDWLACRWAARAAPGSPPRGRRFWHAISDASFGVYLVHAFILTTIVIPHLAPLLPTWWPAGGRSVLIWLIVAVSSVSISLGLLYVPGLSRLMGRACLLPADAPPMRALADARRYVQGLVGREHAAPDARPRADVERREPLAGSPAPAP